MPAENFGLSKSSLAYAKLAATPTDSAWSQVYNAGNLFACLSLSFAEPGEDNPSLQTLGKELFNNLEAEFFTLEEKTLETIGEAIHKSTNHLPENVTINFCLAFFKDHIVYLFLLGHGRVIMKRGEKLGILIERKDNSDTKLLTASGYLQNADTIILETNQFAKNVSDKHVSDALQLELPNDIAEALSLHMHEQPDGGQAAIIIVYHGITAPRTISSDSNVEEDDEDLPVTLSSEEKMRPDSSYEESSKKSSLFAPLATLFSKIRLPSPRYKRQIVMGGLTHRRKIFLSVSCILVVLLIVSIYLTKQQQQTNKTSTLFASVYEPALKEYEEGKGLESLNPQLSNDDFSSAEKLLIENKDKFPKDSKEAKQIEELLAKVQAELHSGATANTTAVKETQVGNTDMLAVEKKETTGKGFSQDENSVYVVTDTAASSIDKSTGKKKELFKNDDDWQQAISIVPYQSNLYILDQKDGILKYIPVGNTFNKNKYLKSTQDLTHAVSMAIDSSVWVLFSDGSIKKFTKGEADSFTISGLQTSFKNPTKIYTDKDIDTVYILDNGNARIVKVSNTGSFQSQYTATIIKQAKDFEVMEKDKKILILSGDKVWEMNL